MKEKNTKFDKNNPIASKIQMKITESMNDQEDENLHALKHLMIHAAKMMIGAENTEIDGMVDSTQKTILLYDNSMNGGNGVSRAIFEKLDLIFQRALDIVTQCDCREEHGCLVCTHWEGCSQFNSGLSKQGSKKLLESLVAPELEKIEMQIEQQSNKRQKISTEKT